MHNYIQPQWSGVYCCRCHCSYRYDDADAVVAVVALIRKLDLWIENSYNKIAHWYLLYKTSTREKAAINKNNNQQQQLQKQQNPNKNKWIRPTNERIKFNQVIARSEHEKEYALRITNKQEINQNESNHVKYVWNLPRREEFEWARAHFIQLISKRTKATISLHNRLILFHLI